MTLFEACEKNDVTWLRNLLAESDPSTRNADGSTALHTAARSGHIEAVQTLLDAGAHTSAQDTHCWTPLHAAAGAGHAQVTRTLLRAGSDASAKGKNGQTALHLAVRNGCTEVVSVLLEHMEDTSAQDRDGYTALHYALTKNHDQAVPLLLESSGIMLAMFDNEGKMPADSVNLGLLTEQLDLCVKQSAYKKLQDMCYDYYHSAYQPQCDAVLDRANEERLELLKLVHWDYRLLEMLTEKCGLSTKSIYWLWRQDKQGEPSLSSCSIIHPVDALLARCLSATGQPAVGQRLRELLSRSFQYWLAAWREMESLVKPKVKNVQSKSVLPAQPSINRSHSPIEIYPMSNPFSGKAIIINNIDFGDAEELKRNGTELDTKSLVKVLKEIGFDTEIVTNLDHKDMLQEVQRFAKDPKHDSCDMVVVVILTHGSTEGLLGTDLIPVNPENIINSFTNTKAPKLYGKPKWFILASCRGSVKDVPAWVPDEGKAQSPSAKGKYVPETTDIYITYPTLPGKVAWRRSDIGTWMVQVLCQQLEKNWRSLSLHEIHQLVHKELKNGADERHVWQTMETSQRGWAKRLYFFKDAVIHGQNNDL